VKFAVAIEDERLPDAINIPLKRSTPRETQLDPQGRDVYC